MNRKKFYFAASSVLLPALVFAAGDSLSSRATLCRRRPRANFAPRGSPPSRQSLTGRPSPACTVAQQKAELISPPRPRGSSCNSTPSFFRCARRATRFMPPAIEPWSEYLTGVHGQGAGAVLRSARVCHRRGAQTRTGIARVVQSLSRRASLNPNRRIAANHITQTHPRTRPQLRQNISGSIPANRQCATYSLRVVMDVVKRYDVDGIALRRLFLSVSRKRIRPAANWIFPTTQAGKNMACTAA